MLHSEEESISNDENSSLRGGASFSPAGNGSIVSLPKPRIYGNRPGESNALLTNVASQKVDASQKVLQASQKENKLAAGCCCTPCSCKPRKKTRRCKERSSFSDRLLSPTFTSLAKTGALDRKKKKRRPRIKRLSEQAVCFSLSQTLSPFKYCSRSQK